MSTLGVVTAEEHGTRPQTASTPAVTLAPIAPPVLQTTALTRAVRSRKAIDGLKAPAPDSDTATEIAKFFETGEYWACERFAKPQKEESEESRLLFEALEGFTEEPNSVTYLHAEAVRTLRDAKPEIRDAYLREVSGRARALFRAATEKYSWDLHRQVVLQFPLTASAAGSLARLFMRATDTADFVEARVLAWYAIENYDPSQFPPRLRALMKRTVEITPDDWEARTNDPARLQAWSAGLSERDTDLDEALSAVWSEPKVYAPKNLVFFRAVSQDRATRDAARFLLALAEPDIKQSYVAPPRECGAEDPAAFLANNYSKVWNHMANLLLSPRKEEVAPFLHALAEAHVLFGTGSLISSRNVLKGTGMSPTAIDHLLAKRLELRPETWTENSGLYAETGGREIHSQGPKVLDFLATSQNRSTSTLRHALGFFRVAGQSEQWVAKMLASPDPKELEIGILGAFGLKHVPGPLSQIALKAFPPEQLPNVRALEILAPSPTKESVAYALQHLHELSSDNRDPVAERIHHLCIRKQLPEGLIEDLLTPFSKGSLDYPPVNLSEAVGCYLKQYPKALTVAIEKFPTLVLKTSLLKHLAAFGPNRTLVDTLIDEEGFLELAKGHLAPLASWPADKIPRKAELVSALKQICEKDSQEYFDKTFWILAGWGALGFEDFKLFPKMPPAPAHGGYSMPAHWVGDAEKAIASLPTGEFRDGLAGRVLHLHSQNGALSTDGLFIIAHLIDKMSLTSVSEISTIQRNDIVRALPFLSKPIDLKDRAAFQELLNGATEKEAWSFAGVLDELGPEWADFKKKFRASLLKPGNGSTVWTERARLIAFGAQGKEEALASLALKHEERDPVLMPLRHLNPEDLPESALPIIESISDTHYDVPIGGRLLGARKYWPQEWNSPLILGADGKWSPKDSLRVHVASQMAKQGDLTSQQKTVLAEALKAAPMGMRVVAWKALSKSAPETLSNNPWGWLHSQEEKIDYMDQWTTAKEISEWAREKPSRILDYLIITERSPKWLAELLMNRFSHRGLVNDGNNVRGVVKPALKTIIPATDMEIVKEQVRKMIVSGDGNYTEQMMGFLYPETQSSWYAIADE